MKKTIVREYQLPSSCIKGKQELTIAFLTDLHDQVTGEHNEQAGYCPRKAGVPPHLTGAV